ncbi:hypothetical protein C1J05_16840 [Sulfitobacter sp. JL08]|uniref:FkbM family methyltransferase n=1 Tax=Sulfitobacter sp. JL08 TaxID=2070369 RepID=UPI000E0BC3CE|nr:FkbM family methyltransferase [Sulfitobacter sp. JL08]AXI55939.1 hypothetical protein C1J05_16840 [Sulfitobacter sp. JL08]
MDFYKNFAFFGDFLRPVQTDKPLIRVGDFKDGGYLVPNDFSGISACYSPGVSAQSSFEFDIAKHGIPSFMADASVDAPPIDVPGGQFVKKFLGPEDDGEFMSLASWVNQTDPDSDSDLLLQMDIEGAEYKTLAATPAEVLQRFRIIVIELHHIPSSLTKPAFFNRAKAMIDALSPDFQSVHLHPNNVSGVVEIEAVQIPRVVEATFLRRDRVVNARPVSGLPNALDCRHNPHRPALTLPQEWISQPTG